MEVTKASKEDKWVKTICYQCHNTCSIKAHVIDGVVVKLEGNPESPHDFGFMCGKGNAGLIDLYNPNRLTKPLRRTNPEKGIGIDPGWEEITYEEALDIIVKKMAKIRKEDPRKLLLSVFDSQSFGQIGRPWFAAFGTPNITAGPAGYYCGNGYHNVTLLAHGTFFAEPDYKYCNYLLLIGSSNGFVVGTNAMGLTKMTADARRRGMKLVVVDPVCHHSGSKADEWIPIRPGTDAAFALGLLNVMLNEHGFYDRDFLQKYSNGPYLVGPDEFYVRDAESGKPLVWDETAGQARPFNDADLGVPAIEGKFTVNGISCKPAFEALKEHVRKYTPEKVEEITTVSADTIRRVGKEFGEAACIGATIKIKDQELPYRPVCANWNRGAIAHVDGLQAGWSIQFLNAVVGAVDVPGGTLGVNVVGPNGAWAPEENPDDGTIIAPQFMAWGYSPNPPRKVVSPQTYTLNELFPVTCYQCTIVPEALLNAEKYHLPYDIDMMFHVFNNYMLSGADPQKSAEAFKKVKFILTFAYYMDESAEFADLVMPYPHWLERFNPLANSVLEFMLAGETDWYFMLRQPVVQPPNGIKNWTEVLLDIAERIDGLKEDYYEVLNTIQGMKAPYALDPNETYTQEEISDRIYKNKFGEEYGLEYQRQHGFKPLPKKIEEAYPRPFLKPKTMVYLESYKRAGENVKEVTDKLGLDWWDVSGYKALPDWMPCPSHKCEDPAYDLWVVNYKVPLHTHSRTFTNPWLNEITDRYSDLRQITINTETAKRKGLKDEDPVWLIAESTGRKIKGVLKTVETIHPEVLGTVCVQGHWAKGESIAKGKGSNFNTLVPYDYKYLDFVSLALDSCIKVKVEKNFD